MRTQYLQTIIIIIGNHSSIYPCLCHIIYFQSSNKTNDRWLRDLSSLICVVRGGSALRLLLKARHGLSISNRENSTVTLNDIKNKVFLWAS